MGAQHSVSVAAAIVDEHDRVLVMQRRDNGHWEAPGGVLEVDESIIDGLKREVFEETGVEIEPLRLTGIYKNMSRGIIALFFIARIAAGRPMVTSEAANVDWWSADTIQQRMDPAYAVRIFDALRDGQPAVRAHDGVSLLKNVASLPNIPTT